MIRIAVCDDDPAHSELILKLIREANVDFSESLDCITLAGFRGAPEVMEYLEENVINVLFLDIELKGMSGFELAAELNRRFPEIIIIFVSAYDDYVFRSFEYEPFRFIRKSRLAEELKPALAAAVEKYISSGKTVVIDTVDGSIELRLDDILYFESSKNYTVAHVAGNKDYRFRSTLSQLEERLKADGFCRIHQAFVVNLSNIKRIRGRSKVLMKNGTELPVSVRRSSDFKNDYMEFTKRRFVK